jgi:sulfite reductase (ferredoxin)
VLQDNLRASIKAINDIKLTTLAACGDVERNVMCCPAPHYNDPGHEEMKRLTDALAAHLSPRTRAYHEIWLTDDSRRIPVKMKTKVMIGSVTATLVGGNFPKTEKP